jgi:hypothetical protein
MLQIDWIALSLFVGAILSAALYGLAASGHFPPEHRSETLAGRRGAVLLWASMALTGLAACAAVGLAAAVLPWYAAVIGGGTGLLVAPLLLQQLPDRFVNGCRSLQLFCACAALMVAFMSRQAS